MISRVAALFCLVVVLTIMIIEVASCAEPQHFGILRTNQETTKWALLIGSGQHSDKSLAPLRGPENDINSMKYILEAKLGFSSEKTQVLFDKAATRTNILAAIDRLARETQSDDIVYLHFSGYGSHIKSDGGTGLTPTILPYDARQPNVPDITVDELRVSLSRLKTSSVFLVLDCSYSPIASRTGKVVTRAAPADARLALYQNPQPSKVIGPGVIFSAAGPRQPALDAPVDGQYHGLFSYALIRALSSSTSKASVKDIVNSVEQELRRVQTQLGLTFVPEPRIESQADTSSPLALVRDNPSEQGSRVLWTTVVQKGDRVVLKQGNTIGALPGSSWAVYPPGETAFAPGLAIASLIVDEVNGQDATARIVAGRLPANGSRAIATGPPESSTVPLRVNMKKERRQKLTEALRKEFGQITFVKESEFARFVVDEQGEVVRVSGADGFATIGVFPAEDTDQLVHHLALLFARSNHASSLVALDNPSSALKIDARVHNAQSDFNIVLTSSDHLNPNKEGQSTNVRVLIYQLKNKEKFEQANEDILNNNDEKYLKDDLVWRHETMLEPNAFSPIKVDLQEETKYVAVASLFRDTRGQKWRTVVPVSPSLTRSIQFTFRDRGIVDVDKGTADSRTVVANTAPARVRIRKKGEVRSSENSLQLSVSTNCDCYISVIDVDPEGKMNLLWPVEKEQNKEFYPDGKIARGQHVLIPDSLDKRNKSGFYFDYSEPPGIDTIRIFATTDLDTAKMIRAAADGATAATITTVNDDGSKPSQKVAKLSYSPQAKLRAKFTQLSVKRVVDDDSEAKPPAGANEANPKASVASVQNDWAATSLTIIVER